MPTGPSKEELEYYFKNSRQYFDELAKQFYDTDREYYDEYIAPFYNPLTSAARSGKLPLRIILVSSMAAIIFGIGIATFFLITKEEKTTQDKQTSQENPAQKQIPAKKTDSQADTLFNTIVDTTIAGLTNVSDYHKGLIYYNMKDYTKAEEYFKKVPADDMNYKDAQRKLDEIRSLNPSDRRYVKPRALERAR
jgi:tetratricopeptide (TPR) repeat protein